MATDDFALDIDFRRLDYFMIFISEILF